MKSQIYLLCILIAFATSWNACKKDSDKPKGDCQIVVQYQTLPELTDGAEIYSDPPGISGYTDATGTCLIRGVPEGTYEVYSYVQGYGGGKTAISILSGQLTNGLVVLIPGYDPGKAPIVDEFTPPVDAQFSPSDSIPFIVKAHNAGVNPADLTVTLESNRDGKFFEGHPDASGKLTVKKRLSKNTHTITLTVSNPSKFSSHVLRNLDVTLPDRVHLNAPVHTDNGISLSWTPYTGSDFEGYEVYRIPHYEPAEIVCSISSNTTTTFTDTQPPISDSVTYYVAVINQNQKSTSSNYQGVINPCGFIMHDEVRGLCIDPATHCIYTMGDYYITRFNYLTSTIEASRNQIMHIEDELINMEIADNGSGKELIVTHSGGCCVEIYNAVTLEFKTEINLNENIQSSTTSGDGYIYFLTTSINGHQYLYSYKRTTETLVSNLDFSPVYFKEIKCIPGQNALLCLNNTYGFLKIYHDNNGMLGDMIDQYSPVVLQDWELTPCCMAPGGGFFLTGIRGRLYTSGDGFIYQNRSITGDTFYDITIATNNTDIYTVGNLYRQIGIYTYPTLSYSGSVSTKGIPKFIRSDGTHLVVLSIPYGSSTNEFLVEVLPMH